MKLTALGWLAVFSWRRPRAQDRSTAPFQSPQPLQNCCLAPYSGTTPDDPVDARRIERLPRLARTCPSAMNTVVSAARTRGGVAVPDRCRAAGLC